MPAATIDPALELPVEVVEVVAIYARHVFDVRHLARGVYTIGDHPRASFPLLSCGSPDQEPFPLIGWIAGAIHLRFTADMHGELALGHERSSLDALITSGRATASDGAFTLALAPGERAVINIGTVCFALRCVPAARRPAYSSGFRWEWRTHALVMFMLLGALLLIAQRQPHFAEGLEFDEWPEDLRFVGFVARPTAPETVHDRIAMPPPRPPADGQPRNIGEQGKQGKPTATPKRGRIAIARRPAPIHVLPRRFNPDEQQQQGGLLGMHRSDLGYFLASPYGWRYHPSDLAARDLWGRRGRSEGEAHGVGGLGFRGTGRSGGGDWYALGSL
ncbi:MAG: hypothetical protein H0T76_21045, partial [Nannocystis sp.]